MKKYKITIMITICLSLILSCFLYKSQAHGLDALDNPSLYIGTGSTGGHDEAIEIGNIIVSIVRTVGESIAVIMLMIIGIRYLLGSAEERAEYKKSMWPYIIGAVLIFAGATLTDWIYDIFHYY